MQTEGGKLFENLLENHKTNLDTADARYDQMVMEKNAQAIAAHQALIKLLVDNMIEQVLIEIATNIDNMYPELKTGILRRFCTMTANWDNLWPERDTSVRTLDQRAVITVPAETVKEINWIIYFHREYGYDGVEGPADHESGLMLSARTNGDLVIYTSDIVKNITHSSWSQSVATSLNMNIDIGAKIAQAVFDFLKKRHLI